MKKNKIILTLILGVVFLAPTLVVNAATIVANPTVATPTQKTTVPELNKINQEVMREILNEQVEAKKTVEIRKTEIKKRIEDNKTETKVLLETKKQEIVKKALEKIFNSLYNKQVKLEEIDAKISPMIKSNKDQGKDVSAIEAQYKIAKMALENVKGDIFETRMITIDQVKVATSKSVMRDMIKTSENKIRAVGLEYRKILPMLAQTEGNNSTKN